MKKILFLFSLIMVGSLSAQSEHKIRIPSIVSPQAYQMLKYTETPVSYASGLPQISIPVYSYTKDDIALNLNLSYHAKGIKVNEIATAFGLGWNLNGLGEITRNVRGLRDENEPNGYIYTDKKAATATQTTLQNSMSGANGTSVIDYEPDLYNISLPNGKSVQFMFAQDQSNNQNNIITYPLSDIKIISPYGQGVNYWQVIDTDGTIYYFGENGAYDISKMKYYTYDPENGSLPAEDVQPYDSTITSWKLTKIKTVNNNIIEFNYRDENYNQGNHCYNNTMTSNFQLINGLKSEYHNSYSLTGNIGKNSVIDNIVSGDVKIVFSKGALRQDLKYSNLINSVDVYSYNVLQRQIKFNFSYFNSTDNYVAMQYGCGQGLDMNELSKRLKLDQVVYNDKNLTKINSYSLEYNTDVNLPNRNSFAQDYWGYYNGQQNINLIPNMVIDPKYLTQYGIQVTHHRNPGADRRIYPDFTQANMLKKIIYPTGGYSIYKFENNRTSYKRDSLDLSIMDAADKISVFASALDYDATSQNPTYYIFKKNLTLSSGFIKKWGIDYVSKAGDCQPIDPNGQGNIDCSRFNIFNLDTNSYVFSVDRTLGVDNYILDLDPGNYEIHIKVKKQEYDYYSANNLPIPDWSVEMNYLVKKDSESYHFGGLRVKEILTYDENNNLVLKKSYSYNRPDKPNLSSGYFYSYPNHMEIKEAKYAAYKGPTGAPPCGLHNLVDGYALNFSSSSYFPLIDLGNYITYTHVEEKEVNPENNQIITHQYKYNFVEPYFHFPSEPQSRQWESGNLLNDSSVNTSKSYLYNYHANIKSVKGIDTSSLNFYAKWIPTSNCTTEFTLVDSKSINLVNGSYELFSNYYFTQTEDITQDNITLKNEFFYSSPNHFGLTKKKTTVTEISPVVNETTYAYAHEKNNQLLISKNMIGIPLETTITQTVGGVTKTLGKTETVYPTALSTPQTGNLVLPLSEKSYDKLNNTMSTDVTYDKYDDKGNIVQYTEKDGTPVTIVWGYNQTEPIATIEGITYDQLTATVSTNAIVSASNDDASDPSKEGLLLNALNDFRKLSALSGKKITTYTYDPLIGVTSITPVSGIREIFVYDTAGRLKEGNIKGKNTSGAELIKTLKKNNYKFKQ
ncbi:hypothetical protein [Chryseobacterium sp. C3]|uniref:hypothetical protein n=1 Tax=Chryseobacterium sp. C3 TaxID=2761532 RepID=UPI00162512C9|nr:hypothetical protein [Chryseobacterium sp. C3]